MGCSTGRVRKKPSSLLEEKERTMLPVVRWVLEWQTVYLHFVLFYKLHHPGTVPHAILCELSNTRQARRHWCCITRCRRQVFAFTVLLQKASHDIYQSTVPWNNRNLKNTLQKQKKRPVFTYSQPDKLNMTQSNTKWDLWKNLRGCTFLARYSLAWIKIFHCDWLN